MVNDLVRNIRRNQYFKADYQEFNDTQGLQSCIRFPVFLFNFNGTTINDSLQV